MRPSLSLSLSLFHSGRGEGLEHDLCCGEIPGAFRKKDCFIIVISSIQVPFPSFLYMI